MQLILDYAVMQINNISNQTIHAGGWESCCSYAFCINTSFALSAGSCLQVNAVAAYTVKIRDVYKTLNAIQHCHLALHHSEFLNLMLSAQTSAAMHRRLTHDSSTRRILELTMERPLSRTVTEIEGMARILVAVVSVSAGNF